MVNGKKAVLVCEDNPDIGKSMKTMLGQLGYDAEVRFDSYEALRVFSENPGQYSVIITDQSMPYMTGTDFARKVASLRNAVPVVLLTGPREQIPDAEVQAAGIIERHRKPLPLEELSSILLRLFGDP